MVSKPFKRGPGGSASAAKNEMIAWLRSRGTTAYKTPDAEGFVVTLTSADAEFALRARDSRQRPISEEHVDRLAREMTAGRWRAAGDPLMLSKEGTWINGQHRLSALAKCPGIAITFKVEIVDRAVMGIVDRGTRKRSLADQFRMLTGRDIQNTVLAAVHAEARDFRDTPLDDADVQRALKSCAFLPDLVTLYGIKSPLRTAGLLGAALRCMRKDRDAAVAFFTAVLREDARVNGGAFSDSAHTLTRKLRALRDGKVTSGGKINRGSQQYTREIAHRSVLAFNAWRGGREITKSQIKNSDAFPEVI